MCIYPVLCIRPNRLYIVRYRSSRSLNDLMNIILNTIKVNIIDGVPFEFLECYSVKQLFLAAGFYSLWWDLSHRLCALFFATFVGPFWPAIWTVVLLGFHALEIQVTVFANTFRECIFRRRARIIVWNVPRKFRTNMFW